MSPRICDRCGAQGGLLVIELAGVTANLCLDCANVVTDGARNAAAQIAQQAQHIATLLEDRAHGQGAIQDRAFQAWVASEVAFLFVHLADRQAFDALADGPRVVFTRSVMDEVVPRLLSILGLAPETPRYNEVREKVISGLNARQLDYGARNAAAVFAQFRSRLERFLQDVVATAHSDLADLGVARATVTWATLTHMLKQQFAVITSPRQPPSPSAMPPTRPRIAPGDVPAPIAPPTRPAQANYFARLWRGDIPLPVTFWGWGVALNLGLSIILIQMAVHSPELYSASRVPYLLYYVFIVVAIWRSSERFKGSKVWGALARISVMLGIVRTLVSFFGEA